MDPAWAQAGTGYQDARHPGPRAASLCYVQVRPRQQPLPQGRRPRHCRPRARGAAFQEKRILSKTTVSQRQPNTDQLCKSR